MMAALKLGRGRFRRPIEMCSPAPSRGWDSLNLGPYLRFATIESRLSVVRTTGPFSRAGSGNASPQRGPGAYTAVKPQRKPLFSQQSGCSLPSAYLTKVPTTCLGSQNC